MNRLCLSVALLVLLGTLGVSALKVTTHKSKINAPSQASHPSYCLAPPPIHMQTRYYYNPSAKLCLPFTYCQSAEYKNNFLTKDECVKTCADV
ncbi:pancreatic trypsin inhibitor isoform X2 [Tupaia chinensis]|uniref:pancreatic trypsin inhibitor isoform X2 n=1 Tax=Tupaia chinensis TaxID=246437 RepID=UPI000704355C|nr:pancreatic trypsin inhibitor isoform X2 [Tupaia chinensis]